MAADDGSSGGEAPPGNGERSIYARALTRVQQDFAKTTDALIQAIFVNAREPTEASEARVHELERRRDELHERLEELEARERTQRGRR